GVQADSSRNGHQSNSQTISRMIASGSMMLPDSADAMTWRVGDHGFRMTLSAEVPGLLAMHWKPWMTRWFSNYNLTPDQIQSWAVHPGGPRILNAFAAAMSISRDE